MKYQEIKERIKGIWELPIPSVPADVLAKFRKKISEKCPKSKTLSEMVKNTLPGGTEHSLLLMDPFPVAMDRASGARMWDIDGNEYVDYLMGAGPIILGHNYQPLADKVIEHVLRKTGPVIGWYSEWETKAIEKIKSRNKD